MWGYNEHMAWWWIFPMAVFWVAVLWLVIRGLGMFDVGRNEKLVTLETPLEIAQKRLAKGEISTEQFEALKKALQ